MRRILTVAEMRESDRYTIDRLGIPEDELIRRAGEALASAIEKKFRGGRILFVCGKGNNGKDGLAAADYLQSVHGFRVTVFRADESETGVFQGVYDIIVDCLFGVGLNRPPEGKYRACIQAINHSGAYVIACDIASGLNADNGLPMECAVKAKMTVAMQELKYGHLLNDGMDYSGNTRAVDIGISQWGDQYGYCLDGEDVKEFFPDRKRNVHKGTFGKACLIGGSLPFSGAALLAESGLAALKTGTGYTNLAVPESLYSCYAGRTAECTLSVLPDDGKYLRFNAAALDLLCDRYQSIAVGMGMGVTEDTVKIISYLVSHFRGKLLIDADGLNALATCGADWSKNRVGEILLTPHVGEFARLTGRKTCDVIENGVEYAKEFAKRHGVTVLLKSCASVITDGVRICVNVEGSAGMAKGGSGDVLSGFLAGLAARGLSPFDAASVGSWIMGRAGKFAEEKLTVYAMTPSDVVREIGAVIRSVME